MDGGAEDYESDPEQARLSLKMRRRQASDDEEEEDHARGRERRINSRVSDCESEGHGAAAEYNNEESDLEEELLEDVEEEEASGEHCAGSDAQGLEAHVLRKDLVDGVVERGEKRQYEQTNVDNFYVQGNVDQIGDNVSESEELHGQEEKKKNEPFAVPTAGAFYMHDDRFRDSVGGRHRRTLGGRNLWESRDDRKWGHDKFEEMSMHQRPNKEGRKMSRGRNQAHGRNKGQDREYSQGNRPKAQDNNNQNNAPNSGRGKGSRRYRPVSKSSTDTPSNTNTSTSESVQFPSSKNRLNSASPPFYPSASSNKEIKSTQKKDGQTGQKKETYYPVAQSNNMQEKNVSDSLNMSKLYIDDNSANPSQPHQASNKGRGQTPTFLPVMQFAGQHPGGIGVPAVGMAFPGYVGQPNGMGKSEMTWLPVLAGTAGSLGAYHAWTAGQTSSLVPALSNINEVDNKVKPYQRSEVANKEMGQRQNKARRYTEMKFGQ